MNKPNLDHPTLVLVKRRLPGARLLATEFRGQTTLVVPREDLLEVMRFLRNDARCDYNFLSDIVGIDYLNYPAADGAVGRFAVVYNLVSHAHNQRLLVKVMLNATLDTTGIADDPTLHLDSVTELWPGAEWPEREVFDLFGITFDGHPDLRRILTPEQFVDHPLRKDYPLRGRGEREALPQISRDSA